MVDMQAAILLIACFFTLASQADDSSYWYRDSVPDVITPAVIDTPLVIDTGSENRSSFLTTYDANERPKIIIFWQRSLTADIESTAYTPGHNSLEMDEISNGFLTTLLKNDVEIVSREFSIRAVAAENMRKKKPQNGQHIEVLSLAKYADKVVEVWFPNKVHSESLNFTIRMTDTDSAELELNVQASLWLNEIASETVLIADADGMRYKKPVTRLSEFQMGAKLANRFMSAFVESKI